MSGLEPLAALGLACNVLQLIEVVRDSASLCKEVYSTGSPYQSFQQRAAQVSELSQALQQPACLPNTAGGGLTPSRIKLQQVATSCSKAADDLLKELRKITDLGNSKAKIIAKGLLRKRKLDSLMTEMQALQNTMDTAVLGHICSTQEAQIIQQEKDFSRQRSVIQNFIMRYSVGQLKSHELLARESAAIKEHISTTLDQSRQGVTEQFDNMALRQARQTQDLRSDVEHAHESIKRAVSDEAAQSRQTYTGQMQAAHADQQLQRFREQILGSLRYDEMNQRVNSIEYAHEETFDWVLRSRKNVEDDSSFESSADEETDTIDGHSEDDVATSRSGSSQPGDPDSDSDSTSEVALDHPFVDWLTSNDPLYWISGKPGSGKSTLMKFILRDDRTASMLNRSFPNSVVLSHFLWCSGTPLQNNLQGLLSSLLYQVFDNMDGGSIANFFAGERSVSPQKRTVFDWELKELEKLLFNALRALSRPVIVFIDGLDEINESNGVYELLALINKLKSCTKKTCVSSRPEPELLRHLERYPYLRMQDLTKGDIRKYCSGFLKPYAERLPFEPRSCGDASRTFEEAVRLVAEKSEGVFLWTHLALRSLQRMPASDTWDDLLKRLEVLPRGLSQLYRQMWQRLNDDESAYRADAANYFCIYLNATTYSVNLLEIVLTLDPALQDAILSEKDVPTVGQLSRSCHSLRERVTVRCAGLLELFEVRLQRSESSSIYEGYDDLRCFRNIYLRPIHKSARDFLTETSEGKEIIRHTTVTQDALNIRMRKSRFCTTQIWPWRGCNTLHPSGNDFELESKVELLAHMEVLCSGHVYSEEWLDLLCIAQGLYLDRRHHQKIDRSVFSPDFLALVATYRELRDLLAKALVEIGSALTTEHRSLVAVSLLMPNECEPRTLEVLQTLLDEGVDLKTRYPDTVSYGLWRLGLNLAFAFETLFQRAIECALSLDWLSSSPASARSCKEFVGVVHSLVEKGADLAQDAVLYLPRQLWLEGKPWIRERTNVHYYLLFGDIREGLVLDTNLSVHLRLFIAMMHRYGPEDADIATGLEALRLKLQIQPPRHKILAVYTQNLPDTPSSSKSSKDSSRAASPSPTSQACLPKEPKDVDQINNRIGSLIDIGLVDNEWSELWADLDSMAREGKFEAIDANSVPLVFYKLRVVKDWTEASEIHNRNSLGNTAFYNFVQKELQELKRKRHNEDLGERR